MKKILMGVMVAILLQGCGGTALIAPTPAVTVVEYASVAPPPPPPKVEELSATEPTIVLEAVQVTGGRREPTHTQQEKLDVKVSPQTLNRGNAVYYVPKTMVVGKASRVDLWVDAITPMDELQKAFAKHLGVPYVNVKYTSKESQRIAGTVTGLSQIYVGTKMAAQLRGGKDFEIDPPTAVTKSLLGDGRAMWDWRVTPKTSNPKGLTLYIDAWVDLGANKDAFPSIKEEVIVPNPSLVSRIPEIAEKAGKTGEGINKLVAALVALGGVTGIAAWFRSKFGKKPVKAT